MQVAGGETLVLNHIKTFGEEIAFQCREKQSNAERGFIVKNIKYGYFGDVCNTVQDAMASANAKWFRVMGIKQRQK